MHRIIVIISADTEWRALGEMFPEVAQNTSPFGG